MCGKPVIFLLCTALIVTRVSLAAQPSANDTIRLGSIFDNGRYYPFILLDEFEIRQGFMNPEERTRKNRLRNDIFVVYPYALTAAAVLKDVNITLDQLPDRRSRKHYLKDIDKKLDATFKESLKNLTIDQGHILIKLINRQTGHDCYSIIREMKGGFSAMLWQSVGVFFNNNLRKEYDPEDKDKEMEQIVQDMEVSNVYKYQLYQQAALLKKISKP
jgi:hypothetical protein